MIHPFLLLAQSEFLEAIRNELRGGGPGAEAELIQFVLGGLGLALLIAIGPGLFRKHKERQPQTIDMLTTAVDALELGEQDRRDLLRIAERGRLEHPAAMLLSPMNLSRAVAQLDAGGTADLQDRVEQLCIRLFGVSLPAPPTDDPAER